MIRKRWFWILVAIAVVAALIAWRRRRINARMGGRLVGPSHEDGGIKAVIDGSGQELELEGNENILTARVNEIKDTYVCDGTPGGIASSLNVIGGGVRFADNGECRIKQHNTKQR